MKIPRGDPIIPSIDICIQRLQGEDDPRHGGGHLEDVRKPLTSNKVFLNEEVVHLKIVDSRSLAEHLNEFNTLTTLLEYVEINFDDEISVLVLLSSLSEVWDGLVMTMSNFNGIGTLKFDDVEGVLLCKEAYRKSSGAAKTSGSVLSIERKEDN